MLSHSEGQTLGNTKIHCKVYRREKEFYHNIDNNPDFKPIENETDNLLTLEGHSQHYRDIYETINREIIEFFNKKDPSRLLHCELTDLEKWQKISKFCDFKVPKDFNKHSGKSDKKNRITS